MRTLLEVNASARTSAPHLHVVTGGAGGVEVLRLPRTKQLEDFLVAAAVHGLTPSRAARLAIERALALRDSQIFKLDVESARIQLNRASRATASSGSVEADDHENVRLLRAPGSVSSGFKGENLLVDLPEHLLSRAAGSVTQSAFHAEVVDEMLAWEHGARLTGRPMTEWSLSVLAGWRANRAA